MENITLGQFGVGLAFLVALFSGISFMNGKLKDWMSDLLKDKFEATDKKIDDLGIRIDKVDMESTKNFLVRFLGDVEQGKDIDDVVLQRFYEQYQHYRDMDGNTYIKHKVEKLESEHKL